MSPAEALAIAGAGTAAGAINTVVGSGSLVTFPTLLAFGYSPLVANVSNNVGLVSGSVSGAWGYRRELSGQRSRIKRLGLASVAGGGVGAALLLILPAHTFQVIVPVFVALAVVGVLIQPRLAGWIGRRRDKHPPGHGGLPALFAVFCSGMYGGYFGAAQGILLLAILGLTLDDDLQRLNGLKNILAGVGERLRGGDLRFCRGRERGVALLIAGGSLIGAQIGARYGRRSPGGAAGARGGGGRGGDRQPLA